MTPRPRLVPAPAPGARPVDERCGAALGPARVVAVDRGPLRLTLVDEDSPDLPAEVEVDLPAPAPDVAAVRLVDVLGELASRLDGLSASPGGGPAASEWWCAGAPLAGGAPLGRPPLVDGALLVRRRARG